MLLHVDGRVAPEVVASVTVRHRRQAARRTGHHRTRVRIRANDGYPRSCAHRRGLHSQLGGSAVHADSLIIRDHHSTQRNVARIGDNVGPGYHRTGLDRRSRRTIGIPLVRVLFDGDLSVHAEIVAQIAGAHIAAHRRGARGSSLVHILIGCRFPGRRAGHRLRHTQRATGTVYHHLRLVVVAHRDVGQHHIACVGNHVRPGYRSANGNVHARSTISILSIGELLNGDRRIGPKVVTRVTVRDPDRIELTWNGRPCYRAQVAILPGKRRSLRGARHGFPHGQSRPGANHLNLLIVCDCYRGQRNVPSICHHVGPVNNCISFDIGSRRGIGVLPICGLLQGYIRRDAKVVAAVLRTDLSAHGRHCRDCGRVGILPCFCYARRRAHRAGVYCEIGFGTCNLHTAVIDDRDACQRDIAHVGDAVSPGNRVPLQDAGTWRRVSILTIGILLQRYRRIGSEVMAVVAVHGGVQTTRWVACDRSRVGVLVGDSRASDGAGHRLVWRQAGMGTRCSPFQIIRDGDPAENHVACVGHHIGPGDRLTNSYQRPRPLIRVLIVSEFLQVDRWSSAKVVAGIRSHSRVETLARITTHRAEV